MKNDYTEQTEAQGKAHFKKLSEEKKQKWYKVAQASQIRAKDAAIDALEAL